MRHENIEPSTTYSLSLEQSLYAHLFAHQSSASHLKNVQSACTKPLCAQTYVDALAMQLKESRYKEIRYTVARESRIVIYAMPQGIDHIVF